MFDSHMPHDGDQYAEANQVIKQIAVTSAAMVPSSQMDAIGQVRFLLPDSVSPRKIKRGAPSCTK